MSSDVRPVRLAVLLSGGGTTLQNLIDRAGDGSLSVQIVLVISSKPSVYGLERAKLANIPSLVLPRKSFPDLAAFSSANFAAIRESGAELVCLAGYLQKLLIPRDYQGKVLNIHPSLLPKFGGKGMYGHHVHEAVIAAGETESGCTVHYVDDEYDHGEIVLQRKVSISLADTPDSLAAKVFEQECLAYPEALRKVLASRQITPPSAR
ncbi:phosphoribosylglycinamide formyltransferase [Telmatocola sphagniphila]|uniref:Phosphoribosylglycinamide formyltransferase n=1 Tax=Telmatocola sphagniphila TaxID=1123043 RepID=A0A8E6B9K5_9BACT|nr:phosphoribosylglycinamide formyltransferase [Telmatocola sphagniphila]QVL34246.1 phosphoribosylglycinamide formyltransferase [Telmatocola sphagniphila]